MASIFRSIFASRPSIGNPHQRVKGHSYDSAIALDPPVKGSYPVAGNGPNLLEEIRRSRAQREISSARRQSSVAAAPTVPRSREDVIERPRTAPIDSNASGGNNRRSSKSINGSWAGRTRSGFSTKSPPSIFRSSSRKERRDSIRSTTEPPVPTLPTPSSTPKPQTYQPKKGPGPDSYAPTGFTPPFAQHLRNGSNASHKSHIDLLDAHSSIRPGSAKHRAKASGVRNYGEDVADRNIDRFGTPSSNPSQLDLSSPQFSYLKTVYAPKKKPSANVAGVGPRPGVHSRVSSALGHVLGDDKPSDDIPSRSHGKSPSIRSTSSTSRPHPLRTETATSPSVMSYTPSRRGRGRDEDRPSSSKALPSQDRRARALSPLSQSNPAQSIDTEPAMRNSVRKLVRPNQASVQAQARENVERELPPVAAAAAAPKSPPRDNNTPSSNSAVNHAVKRMSAMPVTNERPVHPPVSIKTNTNGHGKSKSGSVSYSTFPNTSNRPGNKTQTERTDFAVRPPTTSKTNKRQGIILENSSVPPNLDRVVDLSNTVDTEVTTKTIPAVTHEHVTPIRRQIREERIIREIHTHEVRHHVLPVIDTEILPPRHYIPSSDGKGLIEILEPEVPEHKLTGRMNGNWSLSKTPSSSRSRASSLAQSPAHHQMAPDEYESAEAPVIGLARGDPKPRSRATSRTSNHVVKHSRSLKNLFTEPILTSKKEYMAEEGYLRTEYTWRHPPVFEDAVGRTQPVCICAGLGDQNASTQQFLEDGLRIGEGNCARSPRVEEFLLFRDSGYGSHGMLPGLSALAPTTDNIYQDDEAIVGVMEDKVNFVDDTKIGKVNIAGNGQREATQGLKRIQERRRKSSASKSTVSTERMANQPHLGDLVKGVKGLEV
ncbi:hypothetical protein BKA65DRAFT_498427 [Rhexocercosporidium sp. MPI-PUGE-AT-0058]|nr:hypothetical protein BKA65DRAFT_498427 [Rhexocercosporidium sp. MPI-PUGE-AT-0058]